MLSIVTPARVCLFGDHQDYLGLPIIAAAIDKYMRLEAIPILENHFEIHLPDIQKVITIGFSEHLNYDPQQFNFYLAGMRVAERYGLHFEKGYKVTITSDIPINAGVSSSSALTVSWMHFLWKAFGDNKELSKLHLAQLAYEAEVVEHQSPGGKMDQFTISLGDLLYLETGERLSFKTFNEKLQTLVLAESGIAKETIGTLKNTRTLAQEAIAQVSREYPAFALEECTVPDAHLWAKSLPDPLKPYFIAAVENHHITQSALKIFEGDSWDAEQIGKLMTAHHQILSKLLGVSHPTIDIFLDNGIAAGAFGGKIVGSGGGGCAVLICPYGAKQKVIDALLKSGAKDAYEIKISKGSYATN